MVISCLVEYVEDEFGGYAVGEIWRKSVYISAFHLVRSWRYGLLVVLQGCAGEEVEADGYKIVVFTEVCEAAVYVELIGSRLVAFKWRCGDECFPRGIMEARELRHRPWVVFF